MNKPLTRGEHYIARWMVWLSVFFATGMIFGYFRPGGIREKNLQIQSISEDWRAGKSTVPMMTPGGTVWIEKEEASRLYERRHLP